MIYGVLSDTHCVEDFLHRMTPSYYLPPVLLFVTRTKLKLAIPFSQISDHREYAVKPVFEI
jgi:hypothetical protein